MSRRVFVTGAAGYVGRRVVARLLARGDATPVCLVHRAPTDGRETVPPNDAARWVVGDLREPETYEDELAGCDRVIHLAARTGRAGRRAFWRDNVEGTRALLEACRRRDTGGLLHVSTIAVHFDDLEHYPYAASKAEAEAAVRRSGVPHAIVRPTLVFGPGAPACRALSILARWPLTIVPGDGRATVQPIHAGDLATALADLAVAPEPPSGAHDVGGREALTIRELLARIHRRLGGDEPRFVHLPLRPLELLASGLERLFPTAPPVASGQFATFREDGRVRQGHLQDVLSDSLMGTDDMLDRCFGPRGRPGEPSDG